ncbi:MAG: YkgJ family cysteine cluster protein [Methanoregula sp.]|jgi:hypothetical protein|nr:YkgJ family cysteine cluster protein [Methanoregula sp.]
MTDDWLLRAETICLQCDGHCCHEAHPPISGHCHERLLGGRIPAEYFETNGYNRLRCRPDGTCICWNEGKCLIHDIKPETCRAGPFTFDVKGDVIEIFLKFESICPLVRLLKEVPAAYETQYSVAVRNITHLVSNLTDNELAVICSIDEPDTWKVAEIPRQRSGHP